MPNVSPASLTEKQVAPFDRAHQGALRWMISRFDEVGIQHQLVGGAAARVYGATRPIHNLDFCVPAGCLDAVCERVQPYVTFGPARQHGTVWRLAYLKVRYLSVVVQIADASTISYFDGLRSTWRDARIDVGGGTVWSIGGVPVEVMPEAQLVSYKCAIDRRVDRVDLQQMREM